MFRRVEVSASLKYLRSMTNFEIFFKEPLTQTKPQVANLKPPLKAAQNKKADAENDNTTALRSSTQQAGKLIKKPVAATANAITNKNAATITPPLHKTAPQR